MAKEIISKETRGMFLYSWDGEKEGVQAVADNLLRIGCNAVAINSSYHHGTFLHPRTLGIHTVKESAISFSADLSRYGKLKPFVHQEVAEKETIKHLRDECNQKNIDVYTWWVGLHNSSIGLENPQCCSKNALDNILYHALCPSNSDVIEYACTLFEDTLEKVMPKGIIVEGACFLPIFHGNHHEVSLARVSPPLQFLSSLSFSDSCILAGEKAGIDMTELKNWVKNRILSLLNDHGSIPAYDNSQITSMLFENPMLYKFMEVRFNIVENLVGKLSEIARKMGIEFIYIPSSSPFDICSTFMEGVSIGRIDRHVDKFLPLVYGADESYSFVRDTINYQLKNKKEICAAYGLSYALAKDCGTFVSKISEAVENGAHTIFYYNYGLSTDSHLKWIKKANEMGI